MPKTPATVSDTQPVSGDEPTTITPTYLISLRQPDRSLVHAGIRQAPSCGAAMAEYLDDMPAPFNSYEIVASSSLADDNNWQFNIAFGPFMCLVVVELMTAAANNQKA